MKKALITIHLGIIFFILVACDPTKSTSTSVSSDGATALAQIATIHGTETVIYTTIEALETTATIAAYVDTIQTQLNVYIQSELEKAFGIGREVEEVKFSEIIEGEDSHYTLTVRIICNGVESADCLTKQIVVDLIEAFQANEQAIANMIPKTKILILEVASAHEETTLYAIFSIPWDKVEEYISKDITAEEFKNTVDKVPIFIPTATPTPSP